MIDFKIKAVLFKNKIYKNGESPILIRLTKNRSSVYISTNYTALPSQWNANLSRLHESIPRITEKHKSSMSNEEVKKLNALYKTIELHPVRKKINSDIDSVIDKIRGIKNTQNALNKAITLRGIKELYQEKDNHSGLSLLKFGDKMASDYEMKGSFRTATRYNTIIAKLREYLGNKDLTFMDLTTSFLTKYEGYLRNTKKNKKNTIHTNLKTIRAIYYKAIKEKLIDQSNNPFFSYELEEDKKTKKLALTLEEFNLIKDAKLESNSFLNHARNSFVFSVYNAGIRIGDLQMLKWENVTSKGRLDYEMGKQGTHKSIKLRAESLVMLDFYRPEKVDKEAFIFPFLPYGCDKKGITKELNKLRDSNTTRINNALKEIANMLGIEKKVRNHISRHTFGDLARKSDASIYDISKALGHSSIKITEAYLKNFDEESLDKTMDGIFNNKTT